MTHMRTHARAHKHTHTPIYNIMTQVQTQNQLLRGSGPEPKNVFYVPVYIYIYILYTDTGLFETIFGVLTTCHTEYTSDSSMCVFFI